MDPREKAEEAAKRAEEEKKRGNYRLAAGYHFKASRYFRECRDERAADDHLRSYYCLTGNRLIENGLYNKARSFFSEAIKLAGIYENNEGKAYAISRYIYSQTREGLYKQRDLIPDYIKSNLSFINDYSTLCSEKKWYGVIYKQFFGNIESYIHMAVNNAVEARSIKDYETAVFWSDIGFELSKAACDNSSRLGDTELFTVYSKKKAYASYWWYTYRAKAQLSKDYLTEQEYLEAAYLFLDAAESISGFDNRCENEAFSSYHQWMAIGCKREPGDFESHIDSAIDSASKVGDQRQTRFLEGLKRRVLSPDKRDSKGREELISEARLLSISPESKPTSDTDTFNDTYRIARDFFSAKNYKEASDLFKKSKGLATTTNVQFPNIVQSLEDVEHNILLSDGFRYFINGDFDSAIKNWNDWEKRAFGLSGSIQTSFYQYNKLLSKCIKLFAKPVIKKIDIEQAVTWPAFISENRLSKSLFDIAILTYGFACLRYTGFPIDDIALRVRNRIIELQLGDAAEPVKAELELQDTLNKRAWFEILPYNAATTFDRALSYLFDQDEKAATTEVILQLEPILKVISEFNSKLVWGESNWEKEIRKRVKLEAEWQKISFGIYVSVIRELSSVPRNYCKKYSKKLLKTLDEFAKLRNDIAHGRVIDVTGESLPSRLEETIKSLLVGFPTCIHITGALRKPYKIDINRSKLPKHRINFHTSKTLVNGVYFIEPFAIVNELGEISSNIAIRASEESAACLGSP